MIESSAYCCTDTAWKPMAGPPVRTSMSTPISSPPATRGPVTTLASVSTVYPSPTISYSAPCSDSGNQSVWITIGSGQTAASPSPAGPEPVAEAVSDGCVPASAVPVVAPVAAGSVPPPSVAAGAVPPAAAVVASAVPGVSTASGSSAASSSSPQAAATRLSTAAAATSRRRVVMDSSRRCSRGLATSLDQAVLVSYHRPVTRRPSHPKNRNTTTPSRQATITVAKSSSLWLL